MIANPVIERLSQKVGSAGEGHFAARQLLELYDAALRHPSGTFLEFGTDRGQASNAILAACDQHGGRLVSVDVADCSGAAKSSNWTFVQASSTDRATILKRAPFLADGIDFIYVDSLHTPEHVCAEVYGWIDLVREGGLLYFDDVDSGPYLRGRRKDNPEMEVANRRIREMVEAIFYANTDRLEMELRYGSTGLALLRKRGPLGEGLAPVRDKPRPRNSLLLARLVRRLGRTRYVHKPDGSDLI